MEENITFTFEIDADMVKDLKDKGHDMDEILELLNDSVQDILMEKIYE